MIEARLGERIAVIVASVGRPDELGRWRQHIARQTLQPVEVIWSVTSAADLPVDWETIKSLPLKVLRAAKGSAAQRNAALDSLLSGPDIVAFFDDDYVPSHTCLEGIAKAFQALPEAVGLTGTLIADGINSAGISHESSMDLLASHAKSDPVSTISFERWDGLYGCNMAMRADAIGMSRFDERLPLYGWQEDVDFAMRVACGRPLGRTNAFIGVHQGVKRGRTSGRRFGYSQIANPAYLYNKGSMSREKMLKLAMRNFLSNHARMIKPEPWVDRRGRVAGNWLALLDLARGRITPERILDM